jgi:nucleotide-binding universal stress UspA family protein
MSQSTYKTFLVGVAFSHNLKPNLFEALRMASLFGGRLVLVHVGEKTRSKEDELLQIIASFK